MVVAKSHQTLVVKVMLGHGTSRLVLPAPAFGQIFSKSRYKLQRSLISLAFWILFLKILLLNRMIRTKKCRRQKSICSTEKTHKKRFQNDSSSLVDSTPDLNVNGRFFPQQLSNLGLFDGKETLKGLGSGLARGPFSNVTFAPTSPVSAAQPRKMLYIRIQSEILSLCGSNVNQRSAREDDNDQPKEFYFHEEIPSLFSIYIHIAVCESSSLVEPKEQQAGVTEVECLRLTCRSSGQWSTSSTLQYVTRRCQTGLATSTHTSAEDKDKIHLKL
ncbi:hypothetical protein F5879DRAFT_920411 [Lentinula edodes]|nr:hypothetical protein F5879DRAFT_920411 [Lentinula edodes]